MVTNFDPGVPLESVWKQLSRDNKKLIIQQIREEILKMKKSIQPLIGHIGWDGNIHKDEPSWDTYESDRQSQSVTFFSSEAEFDDYKVDQTRIKKGDDAAMRLEKLICPLRQQYMEKFVLTHGDLHSENIHLRCITDSHGKPVWELSAILD